MKAEKVIPVLRIFDYNKAIEFYVDWLGFKVEWEHHFEDSNYRSAADLSTGEWESILKEKHFIKLARTLPVGQWEQSPEFIAESYRVLLSLLQQPG